MATSPPVQTRQLLAALAAGEAVSGARLATDLGVTRAAVWKHMAALRAAGLPLSARSGAGYCLPWPIQLLDAERIRADLPSRWRQPVEVAWILDSTSLELARRREQVADQTVLLAEGQRQGRGRRGRSWLSPPGVNLYLSCLKRFAGSMAELAGLSLAVGVMVVQALESLGAQGVGLKWPNDVLAGEGKLAGILVELSGESLGPCAAIIGVGINVRLTAAMRADIGQPATDLAAVCAGGAPDRNRLAIAVIEHLRAGLQTFAEHGLAAFADPYARLDCLRGRPLRVRRAQGGLQGIGAGVDERGALRVDTDTGMVSVGSAEVSVRLR